jgi:alpha-aminoadipate/glutamate carrier protein LysW
MVNCPECEAVIDVEEDDLDEGDVLSCDECGASLRVASLNPVELESADDDGEELDEDEDEDEDEEEDDLDYDEEEDEDEEDDWK